MIVVFVCNFMIIYKVKTQDSKRKGLQVITRKKSLSLNLKASESQVTLNGNLPNRLNSNYEVTLMKNSMSRATFFGPNATETKKPFYFNIDAVINQIKNKANNSRAIIRLLLAVSFSFAFLNLPYVIIWLCFYVSKAFSKQNLSIQNDLFAYLQFFEIFYVLKYATHFYINYASSSMFRKQLKYISNKYHHILMSF